MSIRVVLADDQHLIRAGFRALLESEPDLEVVGEAATGREAVAVVRDTAPDVVLMDIRMPDGDGLWATERLAGVAELADTHIVIVTTFELDEYVVRAIRAGASGFLLKDTEPVELMRAIRVVAAGEALLSPRITRQLLEHVAGGLAPTVDTAPLAVLTDREREVLGLVGQGLTNDEIGVALFVSPLTAKTHVSRIMSKLHARDRVQLVVIAYETGLVAPGRDEAARVATAPASDCSHGSTASVSAGPIRFRGRTRRVRSSGSAGALDHEGSSVISSLAATTVALAAAETHPAWGFGWWFLFIPLFWILVIGLVIGLVGRRRRRYWAQAATATATAPAPGGRGRPPVPRAPRPCSPSASPAATSTRRSTELDSRCSAQPAGRPAPEGLTAPTAA